MTKRQQTRPTIGYFGSSIHELSYYQLAWLGIADAAQEHDVNLVVFLGDSLRDPRGLRSQANILYDLVNIEQLDGLIIWSAALSWHVSQEEMLEFMGRYHPLPIVTFESAYEGIPTVLVDSYTSMRTLMDHVLEVHGYRRLAMIRGPEEHHGAREIYRAYVDALTENDLFDPNLVSPPIGWGQDSGAAMMDLLIDERGLRPGEDFHAVVATDDDYAIGAIRALEARGVRVPDDVAVTGHDDSEWASALTPSLTTVRPPYYELGRRATEVLLNILKGEQVPMEEALPSEVVVRQSCGCRSSMILRAASGLGRAHRGDLAADLAAPRDQILATAMQGISEVEPDQVGDLLDGFVADLGESEGAFLSTLDHVLRQTAAAGGDVLAWHDAISTLRRQVLLYLGEETTSPAEDLWQQARVMIGETAQRAQVYQTLQATQRARALRQVSQELATTPSEAGLAEVLTRELPRLGIPSAYVSHYEDPDDPAGGWARLILGHDSKGGVGLSGEHIRFPANQLLPEAVWPQGRRYAMVVMPLYYLERQLGLALLEMGPQDGEVYEALRGQISSALQGALLTQQLSRRAVQLQTAAEVSRAATSVLDMDALLQQVVGLIRERFDLYYVGLFLMQSAGSGEPESASNGEPGQSAPSAWAVLRTASGEAAAQMLARGHKLEVGGESMIGRCIADHRPSVALDTALGIHGEEEAVRFDNPLLPETRSEMALPLVTREGAVGALSIQSRERRAFGEAEIAVFETMAGQLANAISNARAYEQVAWAYGEIQGLNEQLKDENLRMSAELAVTQRLQQMLLPTEEELQAIEELDIAGFMDPADEVGGDYYDVLNHDGQIKIGIGDVTGHGLESGVVMLMLQTAVRTLMTSEEQDPVRFLDILNRLLQENTQRMQVNKSMTLALLDYALRSAGGAGRMRVSGQHEQVIVVRQGGEVELKDTLDLGFPLGLVSGVAEFVHEVSINLEPEDGIVLYSDGITEAENAAGDFYGLERLCGAVSAYWGGTAENVKDAVVADVRGFIGEQKVYDDITLVVVKQK